MTFKRLLVLLMVASTLTALAFMRVNPDRIVPGTDSGEYELMARNLTADRGYSLRADPPFTPSMYREPEYPLFMATVYRAISAQIDAVTIVQAVLLGLSAGLTAVMAARLMGPLVGLMAGVLFGLNSEVAHYAHWLLTEIPFTFLLLLTIGLALRAQRGQRRWDLFATGLTLGLAVMMRIIAGALVVPLAIVLAATTGRHWKERLTNGGLVLAGCLVVLAPWVIRNAEEVGRPTLTSRFGVNLVRRAPRAAEPLEKYPGWIVASVWMMANPISHAVYPMSRFQWGPNYEDNLIWDFHVNEMVRYQRRYEPECLPAVDPDVCFGQAGFAFVRDYPAAYLVQTAFELVKLHFAPLPGPQALIHNTLVWLGLGSMLVLAIRRQLGREHLLVLSVLATYVIASVPVDTQQRYLVRSCRSMSRSRRCRSWQCAAWRGRRPIRFARDLGG